jgi:7-cyano-7-deazaguanine reductase
MSNITQPTDLDHLTQLGQGATQPSKTLEVFPNRHPGRDYTVTLKTSEFTCVCPMTGQPDFADLTVQYVPDQRIVESKSFKLYLWSYRNEGVFHEHVTNVILDDLVAALQPRWCKVTADFGARGGITISVEAEYKAPQTSSNGSEKN